MKESETTIETPEREGDCSPATCSAFDESIAIAAGCLDYGGGYRSSEAELSAFHHGIQTVINSLTAARKAEQTGENDTQVNALRRMGYSIEVGLYPIESEQGTVCLLPCPFCGGEPTLTEHHLEKGLWNMIHRCKVIGPISWDWSDKERHVTRWNTRETA